MQSSPSRTLEVRRTTAFDVCTYLEIWQQFSDFKAIDGEAIIAEKFKLLIIELFEQYFQLGCNAIKE